MLLAWPYLQNALVLYIETAFLYTYSLFTSQVIIFVAEDRKTPVTLVVIGYANGAQIWQLHVSVNVRTFSPL